MKAVRIYVLLIIAIFLAMQIALVQAQPRTSRENIPETVSPEVKTQIELLYSEDPRQRRNAAARLGDMGQQAAPAIPFLAGMLHDTDPVLLRTEGKVTEISSPAKEATEALSKIGSLSVEPLIAVLKDNNVSARRNAVEALGKIKDKRAVEPLIAALNDEDTDVRLSSIEVLGEMGDKRAIPSLTNALQDRRSKVQKSAQESLQKILEVMKNDRAIESLLE
ncbi:MAG: HEAT repeat domain-containing protein, partial [bacterium]